MPRVRTLYIQKPFPPAQDSTIIEDNGTFKSSYLIEMRLKDFFSNDRPHMVLFLFLKGESFFTLTEFRCSVGNLHKVIRRFDSHFQFGDHNNSLRQNS